jgi:hypothetical protein
VYISNVLELDVPFAQLFRCQIESILLMSDVVILAEHTAQITAGEEDTARAIVSLYARLFTEVWRDRTHNHIGSDQTCPSLLVAIHTA